MEKVFPLVSKQTTSMRKTSFNRGEICSDIAVFSHRGRFQQFDVSLSYSKLYYCPVVDLFQAIYDALVPEYISLLKMKKNECKKYHALVKNGKTQIVLQRLLVNTLAIHVHYTVDLSFKTIRASLA